MIKQTGLPLRGRPILLNTRRMITGRNGLQSVLLPLLNYIKDYFIEKKEEKGRKVVNNVYFKWAYTEHRCTD